MINEEIEYQNDRTGEHVVVVHAGGVLVEVGPGHHAEGVIYMYSDGQDVKMYVTLRTAFLNQFSEVSNGG